MNWLTSRKYRLTNTNWCFTRIPCNERWKWIHHWMNECLCHGGRSGGWPCRDPQVNVNILRFVWQTKALQVKVSFHLFLSFSSFAGLLPPRYETTRGFSPPEQWVSSRGSTFSSEKKQLKKANQTPPPPPLWKSLELWGCVFKQHAEFMDPS